jgi:hypothetical protein
MDHLDRCSPVSVLAVEQDIVIGGQSLGGAGARRVRQVKGKLQRSGRWKQELVTRTGMIAFWWNLYVSLVFERKRCRVLANKRAAPFQALRIAALAAPTTQRLFGGQSVIELAWHM